MILCFASSGWSRTPFWRLWRVLRWLMWVHHCILRVRVGEKAFLSWWGRFGVVVREFLLATQHAWHSTLFSVWGSRAGGVRGRKDLYCSSNQQHKSGDEDGMGRYRTLLQHSAENGTAWSWWYQHNVGTSSVNVLEEGYQNRKSGQIDSLRLNSNVSMTGFYTAI